MKEKDNSEFRELLSEAIGSSSKQDFAKRAEMAPQQLSRYLREDYNAKPSSSTLKRIADAAGDPELYEKLMRACGYNETPAMIRKGKPFDERVRLNAIDLKAGLEEMTKGSTIYPSIEDYIRTYEMLYSYEDITNIEVYSKREYYGSKHPMAEYSACVIITFENALKECRTWLTLYFAETRGGKVAVVGAATDPLSIYEAGGMKEESYEQYKDKDFVYTRRMKKGVSSKEALFNAIFGDVGEEYPYTYVGFGFYIKEEPESLKDFLKRHKTAFCTGEEESALYEEAMKSDPAKALSSYSGDNDWGAGYPAAIAKIMEEETGLPFLYPAPDNDIFPNNVPCIMLEGAVDTHGMVSEEFLLEDLKDICGQYALELGIREIGEVHTQTMNYVHKDHVYLFVD